MQLEDKCKVDEAGALVKDSEVIRLKEIIDEKNSIIGKCNSYPFCLDRVCDKC